MTNTEKVITHLSFEFRPSVVAEEGKPIERFYKNGEMALVEWFRFGDLEFNGKYVTEIGYGPIEEEIGPQF